MKGLLYKDFCSLGQMKLYFILILVFSCIPDDNLPRFAAVYASMLPITALAYDERSKWDSFAASLPISKLSLVLSKYLLGVVALSSVTLLTVISRFVYSNMNIFDLHFDTDFISTTVLSFLISLFIQSLLLPLMFKLGVEKGRFLFMIVICITIIGSMSVFDAIGSIGAFEGTLTLFVAIAAAVTFVVFGISVFISSKVYKYSK